MYIIHLENKKEGFSIPFYTSNSWSDISNLKDLLTQELPVSFTLGTKLCSLADGQDIYYLSADAAEVLCNIGIPLITKNKFVISNSGVTCDSIEVELADFNKSDSLYGLLFSKLVQSEDDFVTK